MECIGSDHRSDFIGKLIDTASGQGDLLITLAVATIGGLVALVLQITLHNQSKDGETISLSRVWIMLVSLGSLGVSVFVGYLYQGGLMNTLPVLYAMKIDCSKVLMQQGSETLDALVRASQIQFFTFLIGVAGASAFILLNSRAVFPRRAKCC